MPLARFRPFAIQIVIVLLAMVLNFFHIDHTSLWNDEGFSFFAARGELTHTIRFIADDTQPPLYYLTLNLWLGLGTSVFAIRALSATAMTLALLPLYDTARRLFDTRTALLSTFLFAIAPLDIAWAQKARPYPLQVLLIACVFWGFVRVWQARDQVIGAGVRQAFSQRNLRLASIDLGWFAYVVGGASAMLTQAPAGFFLLGCNAAMALSIFRNIGRNRIMLLNWIIAQLVLALIWMLWLPAFLHQIAEHLTAGQIASKHASFLVSFGQVVGILQGLFGIAALYRPGPVFAIIYAALACSAIVQIARRRPHAWPLPVVIFVPIAACLAGFFLVHPIFGYVTYTFIWILVPYTILIAFGIMSLRPALLRGGVLTIVLIGNAWGIKNVYQTDTPPLDRIAAVIRTGMAPGDGIVLSEQMSGRWGIAYFLGSPYTTPLGLDVQNWGDSGLIHSASDTKNLRRIWVVVLDAETPAIDLGTQPAFTQQVGAARIMRFDQLRNSPSSPSPR